MSAQPVRVTLGGADAGLAEPRVVDVPAAAPGGAGEPGESRTPRFEPLDEARGVLVDEAGLRRPAVVLALPDAGQPGVARREVVIEGWRFELELEPERRASLRERARRIGGEAGQSGPVDVRAIIPGVVVSVAVAAGDTVEAGQELLVVEAMKMQNELRAPRGGTIASVAVGERSTIEVGDLLMVIE